MKQSLFIGSTCADIILNVPALPKPGKDENLTSQKLSIGGCAFNASNIVRQFALPYILCSPVGSGIYGEFIKKKLGKLNIPIFAETPELENGSCYCIVEKNARRTFLCQHGAEYRFKSEWFSKIDFSNVDIIYFCGLEVEDVDGEKIINFLEEKTAEQKKAGNLLKIIFAPGPRIESINQNHLNRIFKLNPILHLNDEEALSYTKADNVEKAADELSKRTRNSVVITEGKNGAYCFDKDKEQAMHIPCTKEISALDTTGAGDCHCGTIIASLKQGLSLFDSVKLANKLASYIVTIEGSTIPDKDFPTLLKQL